MSLKGKLSCILYFFLIQNLFSQTITQTIRGTVMDNQSHTLLAGATLTLFKDSIKINQTTTDAEGKYRITQVPIGTYILKVSYIGYLPYTSSKIIVNSAKEVVLDIEMEEAVSTIEEVTIVSSSSDQVSEWSSVSAKKFTVDETNKYAGSRGDPARMVSNYAGVQGADDSRNDIVVRGNSPLGILWRYDGIDIPNPNHFAVIGNTGGPLSIINNKVLGNSEFFTGAFPAEYGNSIAGVFNLRMRNGNNEKHEFSAQLGLLGTELMGEGPLSRKTGASYLFSYRYSTLKLFSGLKIPIGTSAIPNYQDISIKLNFPFKNGGSMSLFSIGGLSRINTIVSSYDNPDKELYTNKDRDQYFGSGMNVTGITLLKPLNSSTYLKFILATTFSGSYDHDHLVYWDSLQHVDSITRLLGYSYFENRICGNLFMNKRFSSQMGLQAGVQVSRYYFDMIDSVRNQHTYTFQNQINYKGNAFLIQPYIEYKYKITDALTLNTGLHGQVFTLNQSHSIEPRASLRWLFLQRNAINIGVGMHSQMQPTYNYFNHLPLSDELHNKNIGFTKSIHYVLSYDYTFTNTLSARLETYYQYLYDIPVERVPSSFSLINQGIAGRRFYPNELVNEGTGKNYGVELTIQKSWAKNYFYMYTFSLYDSKYKGSDGIERSTDFNGTYAMNLLIGANFKFGERKTLEVGIKGTNAGGRRYTPIDPVKSFTERTEVYIDSLRNTLRFRPYSRLDLKFDLKINSSKITHEIGIDLVNILNTKNVFSISYSRASKTIVEDYQLGFLPIFFYKMDF